MAQDDRRLTWRFYITANDERAARKVVDRAEAEVGRPIDVESFKRSWKDASMQVVDASTAIASRVLAHAVLETLSWSDVWRIAPTCTPRKSRTASGGSRVLRRGRTI